MSNAMYGKGREHFALGDIDWVADDIKVMLVDTADYTVSIDTDEFLSDIPAGAREETSANLTGKTATLGVLDADDPTFATTAGDPCEAIVIYKDTGNAATSILIAYYDTATGLPTTLGGAIAIRWDSGANKILKL